MPIVEKKLDGFLAAFQASLRFEERPLVCVSYILVRTSLVVIILSGFLLIIGMLSWYSLIFRRRKYQA